MNKLPNTKDIVFLNVLKAVKINGLSLKFVSYKLQDNNDIVSQAVKNNGLALKFASDRLQDNNDIVLQSVKKNGLALEYASDRLQNNYNIVLQAIKNDSLALKFASDILKNDKMIVYESAITYEYALVFASDKLQNDKLFLINLYNNIIKKRKLLKYCNYFLFNFNNIENNIFDDNFLNNNFDILHLVKNKINLYNYLLSKQKYDIIYKNKEIQKYIKINYNILILSHNNNNLKYQKRFKNFNIIFI